MNNYKYILVNGYTTTGSSAVVDLLCEYNGVFAPNKEFRIIKDPHGVYDLDKNLNNSTDLLNEDTAAREFLWLAHRYGMKLGKFKPTCLGYNEDFGSEFENVSKKYIEELTRYKYTGYWWFMNLNQSAFVCFWQKVLRKLHIYDFRKHQKMRLFLHNEDEFIAITKEYIDNIFNSMSLPESIDTVVLDQAIPATHPGLGQRYFYNSKVINVERDPRSIYIDLITEEKRKGDIVGHVGFDIATSHNVDLFIAWFKKCRQVGFPGESLDIHFEDLILHYNETVKKIEDYTGIDSKRHNNKFACLKIEVSRKNLRKWLNYEYQDEIEKIKKALPEYIYSEL